MYRFWKAAKERVRGLTIEELVNRHYGELNATDLLIWKYISNHKRECGRSTIYELAEKCCVSRTTVLRFAKKLSLSGYSELRAVLNFESKTAPAEGGYNLGPIFEHYQRIVEDMRKKDFQHINELIYGAGHLYAYATGVMQNNIVNELRRMFNNSGDYIVNIGNTGEIPYFLKSMPSDSLVFIVSLSGEKEDTIEFARKLRLRDIPVISITKLSDNTLATVCNENLYIHTPNFQAVEGRSHFVSSVGFFAAVEVLYLNYQIYKEERRPGRMPEPGA